MSKFEVRFVVREEWVAWYEADSLEEAQAHLDKALDEDINLNELPKYEEKNKGIYVDIDPNSLEEVSNV